MLGAIRIYIELFRTYLMIFVYNLCVFSSNCAFICRLHYTVVFYSPAAVNGISNRRKDLNNQIICRYICPPPTYILLFTCKKCRIVNCLLELEVPNMQVLKFCLPKESIIEQLDSEYIDTGL